MESWQLCLSCAANFACLTCERPAKTRVLVSALRYTQTAVEPFFGGNEGIRTFNKTALMTACRHYQLEEIVKNQDHTTDNPSDSFA